MERYVASSDNTLIHFTASGHGDTAIIFVHGWLGSGDWWNLQKEFFSKQYCVITLDLAGHGKSGKGRREWSGKLYADDIMAVVNQVDSERIVLVGHSMAGAYVLEAALLSSRARAIILIDTLKNLDQLMTIQQAEERILGAYRKNFNDAVENLLPKFLFCDSTPEPIRQQLQKEFLRNDPEFAVNAIEPLYKMDIRELAKRIEIPVRAINSTFTPTNRENNQKYFRDFDFVSISDTGHYPMLEKPEEFNDLLHNVIKNLGL
ncbi:possible carboxylesterase, Est-1 [Candidatus Moduliflexus flocculans]|uniref:Possible carboxylesterase, Est-1 n=1 Tax=Candidatus Moduliflexus flocculans TaxID=1499966 RepID=A0A0S6W036_9BACT|nr:possible carboxylesterase, Est-1 [Candidatus Moduliflexus flocculans]